jgi:WD40 repeat protein
VVTSLQLRAHARTFFLLLSFILAIGIAFAPAQRLRDITFGEYFHRVTQVALSPDGTTVACICQSGSGFIRLSDVKTGKEKATLRGGGTPLLVFTPDGKSLISGQFGHTPSGKSEIIRVLPGNLVGSLSPNVLTSAVTAACAVDIAGPQKKGARKRKAVVERPPLIPRKYLAQVWDVRKGTVSLTFPFETGEGELGVITPDSKTLIVTGTAAGLYDLNTGKRIAELASKGPRASLLALSRDGKWLATMHPGPFTRPSRPGQLPHEPDQVLVWDIAARKKVCEIRIPRRAFHKVTSIALSPDGKQVAIGLTDELGLYDCATGMRLKVLDIGNLNGDEGGISNPCFMSFTPNGSTLVIAGTGRGPGIALWEPATDKVAGKFDLARKETPTTKYTLGALSPSGTVLATVGRTLQVWDLPAAKELKDKPVSKD